MGLTFVSTKNPCSLIQWVQGCKQTQLRTEDKERVVNHRKEEQPTHVLALSQQVSHKLCMFVIVQTWRPLLLAAAI